MTEKFTAEILVRAAELLGEKGWCQGTPRNAQGEMCARGAICAATHELAGDDPISWAWWNADSRLRDYVNKETGLHMDVPDWNDMPERTAEDVILMMKRAASE